MHVVWNIKKKPNCFILKCVWGWVCVCVRVYMCVCGVWWGGGCNDSTESYGGDLVQLIIKEPKSSYTHPLPQVMNNDRPPFSYLFIYFFILFIYLFIHFLSTCFFSLRESTKRNYVTWHIWDQFIWMRFGILLYPDVRNKWVRKKWFPSERRVSHLRGTRHATVQHWACARGSILASRAPISAIKDNIGNHALS